MPLPSSLSPLQYVFQHSPIGIGVADLDLRWIYVNPALCSFLGVDAQTLLSEPPPVASRSHPEDAPIVSDLIQQLLLGQRDSFSMTKRCLHADGHTIWSKLTVVLHLDHLGQPAALIAQFDDITDLIHTQRALQHQLTLHQLITNHAHDLISALDLRARFTFASQSYLHLLGLDPASLLGLPALHLLHPDDHPQACLLIERVYRSGSGQLAHLRARHRDGHTIWLEGSLQPVIEDARLTGFIAIARPATAQHNLPPRLALIERQIAISSFATSIAHELNNPLAYALSNLQYTLDHRGGGLSEDSLDALSEAHDGVRRALTLIQDLQLLATPANFSLASLHLHQILHSAVQLASKLSPAPCPIQVTHTHDDLRVWSNEGALHQILLALLANASRALQSIPSPHLHIHASRAHNSDVLLTITDNGPPIPPELLPNVFDPFAASRADGDGLSLAIAHRLAQQIGASLVCESSPDSTTFSLYLPTSPRAP